MVSLFGGIVNATTTNKFCSVNECFPWYIDTPERLHYVCYDYGTFWPNDDAYMKAEVQKGTMWRKVTARLYAAGGLSSQPTPLVAYSNIAIVAQLSGVDFATSAYAKTESNRNGNITILTLSAS